MTWTIQDTRGYLDAGPSCSECGACECVYEDVYEGVKAHEAWEEEHGDQDDFECIGLSYVFCNDDDGADNLCEDCAMKVNIVLS